MRAAERGAVAVIVAVVLALLCGFVALSLDAGHVLSVRGELQNGADGGALAGAKRLSGRNQHFELAGAVADARTYARSHPTDVYDVEPTTIELGRWIPPVAACGDFAGTPAGDPGPDGWRFCSIAGRTEGDAANINAVRVVTTRGGTPGEAAGGGAVELAFGAFVGHRDPAPVGAEAIALAGGPASEGCPDLPVAVRAGCLYDNGRLACDANGVGRIYYVGLSSAPIDTAGLTSLSEAPASANRICDVARRSDDCSQPLNDGVSINLQEGTSWSANCTDGCSSKDYHGETTTNDSICEVIRRKADRDCDGAVDLTPDGKPAYKSRIPVVQYPGESLDSCEGGDHWNQSARIVGWATVAVVSARCEDVGTTNNKLPMAPAAGAQPITAICDAHAQAIGASFSTASCVAIQLFCDEENDEQTAVGGGWFGTSTLQPVLVR